ncbi:MAG: hypothetical protein EU549_00840 [Promethearchaeota archaeon]|nr:MAG: hypothetical protein EU549_00840 [Candidatus Lokiarchaeota archaeon]
MTRNDEKGILGIRIITSSGLPIYKQVWSEKIAGFESKDQTLQAGFMTAILNFAKEMKHHVGFIRFYSENDNDEKEFQLSYGIDALVSLRENIVFILFLEPYIFKNRVELKIDWIYDLIIKNYNDQINKGEKIKFTEEEEEKIRNILFDNKARRYINKRSKKLKKIIKKKIHKQFSHENILGIAICSFDNSILYTYLIEIEDLEDYLNNMGLITRIKEWECQYKPIWLPIPDKDPVLVSVINSAMQVPIIPGIDNENLKIPYFYYLVSDQDALLGPLTESLLQGINPFFLEKE